MASSLQRYRAISYEFNQLHNKVLMHIDDRTSAEGYVYADTYRGWVNEYNQIVKKCNDLTGANLSLRSVQEYELSSTHKTVRTNKARAFARSIEELANRVDSEMQTEQNKDAPIPAHQMRVCFKTGVRGCPLHPPEKKNRVFVAIPFDDDYRDSYEYGIKIVLDQLGIEYYRADGEISNKDIMCKICCELQSCGKVRTCIHSQKCRMGERFCRKTRQIFAGILCVWQEYLTKYSGKRSAQTAY